MTHLLPVLSGIAYERVTFGTRSSTTISGDDTRAGDFAVGVFVTVGVVVAVGVFVRWEVADARFVNRCVQDTARAGTRTREVSTHPLFVPDKSMPRNVGHAVQRMHCIVFITALKIELVGP